MYILQAVVAEADAPRADAAFEVKEIEGVAEALAGYVAAQYATEAVRACINGGIYRRLYTLTDAGGRSVDDI